MPTTTFKHNGLILIWPFTRAIPTANPSTTGTLQFVSLDPNPNPVNTNPNH